MEIVNIDEQGLGEKRNQAVSFAVDILKGLGARNKSISSKYLYDQRGSELFSKICQQEEYYLTRAEEEILANHAKDIARLVESEVVDVIELGVGDGRKTKILLEELATLGKDVCFYGVDISASVFKQLERNLPKHPRLKVRGIVGDYLEGLAVARSSSSRPALAVFLGSNIGNLAPQERRPFFDSVRASLRPGDMLLTGFDLKKDLARVSGAYNDSAGVTAQFSLNALERINRELGGKFDLKNFSHYAFYNPRLGAVETYLIAEKEQKVWVEEFEKTFSFKAFEGIHLEYAFKFAIKDIEQLAQENGFGVVENFCDRQELFADSLWQAAGSWSARGLH